MSRDFAFPDSRPRYAPDRVVDIEHIALELEVDPGADSPQVSGVARLRFSVLAKATQFIELDAVELDILAVTATDDRPCEFRSDGKKLRVDLGSPLEIGTRLTIAVTYRGAPRRGLYFIAPDAGYPGKPRQIWSQGQDEDSRYWFPCFDSPNEKATSEVMVTVPGGMFALSNGDLIADYAVGERRRLHWRLDVPHSCYLITLAVGDFATITTQWRDIPVSYHVQRGFEAAAERTLARTPAMLELFSTKFGIAYPYPRYAQVFVADFIFGGMENTSATTLTDTVLIDERAALDYDIDSLVAHELAHQWFGDLVTCRDWGEGWLNEGFATYSEYLWREHYEGRDAADLELDEWAEMYFGEDSGRYRRTVATKIYDEPIDIFDHHLYEKGGRVLHMLRNVLGDEAFFASLAFYLNKHKFGAVETRDLARAVEGATGRVLDWFFSQWIIDGAGHPELEISVAWEADSTGRRGMGRAKVAIAQKQKIEGKTPLFRLPTTLRFRLGERDHDVAIEITELEHTFYLPFSEEPTQIIVDPGRVLLAEMKIEKPQAMWARELEHATLAMDRIAASRALGKLGGMLATAALDNSLRNDRTWSVRAAAANALGHMQSVAARDALLAAVVKEQHPRARRGVVAALGAFVHDATVGAALAAIVRDGDASYFVEAEACLALGKVRAVEAPVLLRVAATRESFTDVIRQHAYRGLAAARDDSAVGILLDGARWGHVTQGRRAAVMALAELCRGRRDREAREIREQVERLLADPDFRVQAAAVEALNKIGDAAAVGALRKMIDRELDGRLRRRGREVIRELQEGAPMAEELRHLRDTVDELRKTATSLRERVEKLEAPALSDEEAKAAKKARKAAKKARKAALPE